MTTTTVATDTEPEIYNEGDYGKEDYGFEGNSGSEGAGVDDAITGDYSEIP